MKKSLPILLCCALLAGTVATSAPASAQSAAIVPPAIPVRFPGMPSGPQLNAARGLLQAMEMPRLIHHALNNTPNPDQESLEVSRHMGQHVSDNDIADLLAPVYVRYLSVEELNFLAQHFRVGVGRRQVVGMLANLNVVDASKRPVFSDSEKRELQAFDKTPASKAFVTSQRAIQKETEIAIQNWRREYYVKYTRQALLSLKEISDAAAQRKPGEPAPQLTLKPTGMDTLDKTVRIVAENNIEIVNARRAMQTDLQSYAMDGLLRPQKLVSAEGIASSRASLTKAEQRMERYLKDMDTMQKTYRDRITAAMPSKQSLAAFEPSMTWQYDQLVRFGENQRGLFDVFGRTLDFAESRLGTVVLRDETLVFASDDDAKVYNALVAQMKKLAEEETAMAQEGPNRMKKVLEK
jgi:hypothetical protein